MEAVTLVETNLSCNFIRNVTGITKVAHSVCQFVVLLNDLIGRANL